MIQWGFVFFDSSSQQSVCSFFSGVSYTGFYFKATCLKEKIINLLILMQFIMHRFYHPFLYTYILFYLLCSSYEKKKLVLEEANYVGLCQQGHLGARVSLITRCLGSNSNFRYSVFTVEKIRAYDKEQKRPNCIR